jgi:hypothetical protein
MRLNKTNKRLNKALDMRVVSVTRTEGLRSQKAIKSHIECLTKSPISLIKSHIECLIKSLSEHRRLEITPCALVPLLDTLVETFALSSLF